MVFFYFSFFILASTTLRRRGDPIMLCIASRLWSVLSTPVEDKPFKLEFTSFLVKTGGCETVIGFVLLLALTELGTLFSSLEVLSGLILNIPGAITLSLFTPLDSYGVKTEFEVTGFDKACVSPTLGRFSTIGCFGKMPTKIELTLEQSQQGVSYDVLVSIEGVEE
uniref:Uncharacterized protein n=1 Tax=Tanacetum cinerariifolium TaxID=118510 RepID=A0A6L2K8I3_TANCI|nr:hypothetical protein [Tanacetum cinerariifolium]